LRASSSGIEIVMFFILSGYCAALFVSTGVKNT